MLDQCLGFANQLVQTRQHGYISIQIGDKFSFVFDNSSKKFKTRKKKWMNKSKAIHVLQSR